MAKELDVIPFFKKNRIAIIAVLAFVVAVCSVFVFAGNNSEEPAVSAESTVESEESSQVVTEPTLLNGYGIYIDGYFVAAANTEEQAIALVSNALDARVQALNLDASANNSFLNSVSYVEGNYIESSFTESIVPNLNNKVTDYSGELLPVTLSVKTVTTYSENVVLDYDTKTYYTDGMKDGATDVSQGFNGEGIQTYEVISVNGVESTRNPVSLQVITEPVDEVIYVGTRSDGEHSVASVMNFVEPYKPDRWIITSYMGPRWGTVHNGIDIARDGGCFGDPAYAACDGVVIKASDTGNGYGKCVIIDHGNGVTTLYAHFTKCLVEVGDVVKAGDEVGLIGSTGYSFGPHLHFEVRIDDVPVNPIMFVDYE